MISYNIGDKLTLRIRQNVASDLGLKLGSVSGRVVNLRANGMPVVEIDDMGPSARIYFEADGISTGNIYEINHAS